MRLRGLFDVISNLFSGQSGFWVPLQIYPRLHEVSGSLDTPSKLYTGRVGVSVTLLQIDLRVHEASQSP